VAAAHFYGCSARARVRAELRRLRRPPIKEKVLLIQEGASSPEATAVAQNATEPLGTSGRDVRPVLVRGPFIFNNFGYDRVKAKAANRSEVVAVAAVAAAAARAVRAAAAPAAP